jgi:hypothetical protein
MSGAENEIGKIGGFYNVHSFEWRANASFLTLCFCLILFRRLTSFYEMIQRPLLLANFLQ